MKWNIAYHMAIFTLILPFYEVILHCQLYFIVYVLVIMLINGTHTEGFHNKDIECKTAQPVF